MVYLTWESRTVLHNSRCFLTQHDTAGKDGYLSTLDHFESRTISQTVQCRPDKFRKLVCT
jgi:hypothetical protein